MHVTAEILSHKKFGKLADYLKIEKVDKTLERVLKEFSYEVKGSVNSQDLSTKFDNQIMQNGLSSKSYWQLLATFWRGGIMALKGDISSPATK